MGLYVFVACLAPVKNRTNLWAFLIWISAVVESWHYIAATELKDPICHSVECQIGSFSSEAMICSDLWPELRVRGPYRFYRSITLTTLKYLYKPWIRKVSFSIRNNHTIIVLGLISWLALSASFEYLCHIMDLPPISIFYSFSAGIHLRRLNLTSKVGPRSERV